MKLEPPLYLLVPFERYMWSWMIPEIERNTGKETARDSLDFQNKISIIIISIWGA